MFQAKMINIASLLKEKHRKKFALDKGFFILSFRGFFQTSYLPLLWLTISEEEIKNLNLH